MTDSKLGLLAVVFVASAAALAFNVARQEPADGAAAAGGRTRTPTASAVQVIYFGSDG